MSDEIAASGVVSVRIEKGDTGDDGYAPGAPVTHTVSIDVDGVCRAYVRMMDVQLAPPDAPVAAVGIGGASVFLGPVDCLDMYARAVQAAVEHARSLGALWVAMHADESLDAVLATAGLEKLWRHGGVSWLYVLALRPYKVRSAGRWFTVPERF